MSKIEYEKEVVKQTVRVKYVFDTGEKGQVNFPVNVEEKVIIETLKDLYQIVQNVKNEKQIKEKKRKIDW